MTSLASIQVPILSEMAADDPGIVSAACAAVGRASNRISSLLLRAEIYQLDRGDLHILLDAACDLRDAHAVLSEQDFPNDFVISQAATHARAVAQVMLEQIAEWTEFSIARAANSIPFQQGVRNNRARLAALISRSPSLLPKAVRDEFAQALRDLDSGSGEVPEPFTPLKDAGKGARPIEARLAREYLCYWIRWAQGAGWTRHSAIAHISDLRGTPGPDAVKKWLEDIERKESKREILERYRQDGKAGILFLQGRFSPQQIADILHHARRPRSSSSSRRVA